MKLMNVDEYIQTFYTALSRPTRRTLIRLILQGEISGKKIGKFYYVDLDMENKKTGNLLVDRVLGI